MKEIERQITEAVPYKEITLTHIIKRPSPEIYAALELPYVENKALGIMKITPPDTISIVSDGLIKSAEVELILLDRFNGSACLTGNIDDLTNAMQATINALVQRLGCETAMITYS